ncbi:MAG: hypothetical protein ACQR33_06200 [Candidatus Saccharibacteria bacterium]
MYGKGAGPILSSTTVTGAGVVMLPSTSGNTLGSILAYSAISIGVLALMSQLTVRVMRRKYTA